jgi:phosphoribosylaminoimidazolecarboxamide formyltransferase / IMP cyclohydrolase
MVGVGAGQQSRVDCVKLAGKKVATWWLRQHPKVRSLPFKASTKRQARVNARVAFIEGDFSSEGERLAWLSNFEEDKLAAGIAPLTSEEKSEWLKKLKGVSLASDAFFPFRDSIDWASRYGVSFVAQPGGSVQDEDVKKAAEEHGMIMAHNGLRLFHH